MLLWRLSGFEELVEPGYAADFNFVPVAAITRNCFTSRPTLSLLAQVVENGLSDSIQK